MTGDTLTVMRAHRGRLAKLIMSPSDIRDYDAARLYDATETPVDGLPALFGELRKLAPTRHRAVVRGSLIDGPTRSRIRRLLHRCPDNSDPPTLLEVPRKWIAIDLDGVHRPDGVDVADVAACAGAALSELPKSFARASYIAQATSSHGFKPGSRLRLWFWLSRPVGGEELKRWFLGRAGDTSVFSAAQLIYTAAPLFAPDVPDPVSTRLLMVPGETEVQVPNATALAPPSPPQLCARETWRPSSEYVDRLIERQIGRVACAADTTKHHTLRGAARTIGGLIEQTTISESEVISRLLSAVAAAGAIDLRRAEATARWGLQNGRASPLSVGRL